MAGYDVEFVKKPDSLLQTDCAICHLVLRKPCETTCCGVYFCRACIEQYQDYRKSCPHCREDLNWQVSKAQEKLIKQLKVVCKYKSKGRGCKWVGELGQLDTRLNKTPSSYEEAATGCLYASLMCPRCKAQVKRINFYEHKTEKCPFKNIHCSYWKKGCDWMGQKKSLTGHLNVNHSLSTWLEGRGYVELSSSFKCGRYIVRKEMKKHEAKCQLEVVACEFWALGCLERLARKDMETHTTRPETHMQHLHQACATLQQRESEMASLQLSLKRKDSVIKQQTSEIEKLWYLFKEQTYKDQTEIEDKRSEIVHLQNQLKEHDEEHLNALEMKQSEIHHLHFTLKHHVHIGIMMLLLALLSSGSLCVLFLPGLILYYATMYFK